jgi:hypothetical protein
VARCPTQRRRAAADPGRPRVACSVRASSARRRVGTSPAVRTGGAEPPRAVVLQAQGPRALGSHRAVDTGARAEEDGGALRRGASRRAPPQEVAGPRGAVPGAPPRGQELPGRLRGQRGGASRHGCGATSAVSSRHRAMPMSCGPI